jgi:glycosyltransferase involved in cell wall biosynthesis
MNILYISSLFPPSIGGGENYVKWTAEELVKGGDEVSVFTANATHSNEFHQFPGTSRLPKEEEINGVYIRRFDVNYFANALCSDQHKIRGAYRLKEIMFGETIGFWEHGPILHGMFEEIKRHKPDLIVAVNNYFYTTYLAYLAQKEYKIPLIIVPLTHTSNTWCHAPVLSKIYNKIEGVIVSTEFEKNFLMEQGTFEEKIHVLAHGIDPKEFDNADGERFRNQYQISDAPLVSFIGRKIKGKGADTLVKAMRLVWQQEKNVQLALVGPDSQNPLLESQLEQLTGEERRRTFNIDRFTDQEKKDIFAASDIFAMPSNVDSFGLVFLEAWRSAVPVIACRKTAQESFMRPGIDSLLVDYGNEQQLAQAILLLVKNKDLCLKMGQNAQKRFFESHTLEVYTHHLRNIFIEILQNKTRFHTPIDFSIPHSSFGLAIADV